MIILDWEEYWQVVSEEQNLICRQLFYKFLYMNMKMFLSIILLLKHIAIFSKFNKGAVTIVQDSLKIEEHEKQNYFSFHKED